MYSSNILHNTYNIQKKVEHDVLLGGCNCTKMTSYKKQGYDSVTMYTFTLFDDNVKR